MRVTISELTAKSTALLAKAQNILDKIGVEYERFPTSIYEDDKCINIVFAGQYSAGKSSILKMLTGRTDIVVGEGITTQETHSYDWNGIVVTDTPGIHTTLRPDHDAISYEAIAKADMLVFVVTNELFDSHIGSHFRKLAIDKGKAENMILVVNKMAREGNTPELQEIKKAGMREVIQPYSLDKLYLCFLDAESYNDSIVEEDKEYAEELLARSGYRVFIETLNRFIQERKIPGRLTAPLHQLQEVLDRSISNLQTTSDDSDLDALKEQSLQEKKHWSNTKKYIKQGVEKIYTDAGTKIRNEGNKVANLISDASNEDEVNQSLKEAGRELAEIEKQCIQDIQEKINSLINDREISLRDMYSSDFYQKLKGRINLKKDWLSPKIKEFLKSDALEQAGKYVVQNTVKEGANKGVFFRRNPHKGSNVYETIKEAGEVFGHKLSVKEATKWTQRISMFGKTLAAAGIFASIGMQYKEDVDMQNKEVELRKVREEIRCEFNNMADELEKKFSRSLQEFVNYQIDPLICKKESDLDEVEKRRVNNDSNCLLLKSILEETRTLIGEIDGAYTQ